MGIFSLFGKKDRPPGPKPTDEESARKKRENSEIEAGRLQSAQVQRKAAQATAKKIDDIESEMSSEFVRPTQPGNTGGNTLGNSLGGVTRPPSPPAERAKAPAPSSYAEDTFQPTMPVMGLSTQFLLGSETVRGAIDLSQSEATPVIEEAAILFANDQSAMVEQVLLGAVQADDLGSSTPIVWGMLFDLYQVTGKQLEFDNLSIEYANKFETSPPAWLGAAVPDTAAQAPLRANATPAVPFSGKLDANIAKLLERAQNLAEKSRALRLEFVRVTEVDPIGCGMLLSILKRLQKSGHDLILVGAPELALKVRAILEVGRRDETEAPWLLLLELLRLLNLESEFEEASIDYCVTFEVSPPAFVPPKNKVTTEFEETASDTDAERLMMPAVIEGRTDLLIASIATHAAKYNPAIIDCARLTRVDFGSAGQLLSGLAPLAQSGTTIEMHNVNHLVTALFNVMGMRDIVRILPRKN